MMEREEAEAIARHLLDNNIMFSALDDRDRERLVRDMALELRGAFLRGTTYEATRAPARPLP